MLFRALTVLALVAFIVAVGILGSIARQRFAARALPIHPFTGLRAIGIVAGRPVYPIFGGDGTTAVATALRERREALSTEIDGLIAAELPTDRAAAEAANLVINERLAARQALDERIRVVEEQEVRRQAEADTLRRLPAARGGAVITSEPRTYDPAARHSYFLDMARAQLGRGDGDGGVGAARERLARHTQELDVELGAREGRRDQLAYEQADGEVEARRISRASRETMFEKRVNPNRTDGQGGNFVPPLWLVDEYVDLPRFGRTTANLCRQFALPTGTDSINLPKIATGTSTAIQTADAAGVSSTDLTDTSVSAGVKTIAGQQDIALQLLDQSPVSFDEVVFQDLIADYNQKLDVQVINGSNGSGQVKGILNVSGINAVTYTDATPTLPELWVPLLQSASKVAVGRVLPATGVVMTPSMWYWALSQLDSTSRPLLLGNGGFNQMGNSGEVEADGPAGMFTYGLPAFLDGNIPSNLGGGTNETRVITARWDDLFLWEGSMRTRVLSEVLSGTLQVRIQVYNYVAFMGDRRPTSISVISGTGVIPTAGF
jgi:HK97 family phage major capsid protein